MKKTVKKVASLVLAGAVISNAFALDFGGLFTNNSKLDTQSFSTLELVQLDSLTGWIKTPVSADEKLYFAAETEATYRLGVSDLSQADSTRSSFFLDLSLCKLTYYTQAWGGILNINFGRFLVNDSTRNVLAQTTDGAQLTFNSNVVKAIAYAGYTGLTNSRSYTILDSPKSTFKKDDSAVYQFNSPYVVTGISVSLPFLFKNQTIGFEGFGMFGLPGIAGDNSGDIRIYATAIMNGPIVQNLYYSVSSTFGFFDGISNLTKAEITYYPPVLSSAITFGATYASGRNGALKPFTGFTSQKASLAYDSPEYRGILKTGLSGTMHPTDKIFCNLAADAVFSCMDGFDYNGFQWLAQFQYQIFTDLKAGLSAYQFYGKDSRQNNTSFTLNLVFAF